jgi:hypothetical protein
MIDQNEMIKLAIGLHERNIQFTARSLFSGLQITCKDGYAICHEASYGHQDGLIEIIGFDNDVIGNLTAKQVLEIIDKKQEKGSN